MGDTEVFIHHTTAKRKVKSSVLEFLDSRSMLCDATTPIYCVIRNRPVDVRPLRSAPAVIFSSDECMEDSLMVGRCCRNVVSNWRCINDVEPANSNLKSCAFRDR